jgi:hypothetical protein
MYTENIVRVEFWYETKPGQNSELRSQIISQYVVITG